MTTPSIPREIVLDTETTGLSPADGDRIVEIGCIELINHIPTGKNFHTYLNPDRDMPAEAFKVHGLSEEFLSDKPSFSQIAQKLLSFLGSSTLVIHNAKFDMGFLNAELENSGNKSLQNPVIDTVRLAREKHPGARVGLDALCRHYGIDNSHRTLHGALLDSEILAEVYLELLGGRQAALTLAPAAVPDRRQIIGDRKSHARRQNPALNLLTQRAKKQHRDFLNSFEISPLWKYPEKPEPSDPL